MATSAKHGHMSKRRLLVIILTSTTTFMVAMGVVMFLCWVLWARQRRNNESTMKIWTN
jgi:heme/copper-type cytochrome/quinol oxidase subunit 2